MELKLDIDYQQLIGILRQLPKNQLAKILSAIQENPAKSAGGNPQLRSLLLSGPTLSNDQVHHIQEAREAISKWRTI